MPPRGAWTSWNDRLDGTVANTQLSHTQTYEYQDAGVGRGRAVSKVHWINPSAAAKLAYILTCLHRAVETEMVEQRIADLEKLAARRNGA